MSAPNPSIPDAVPQVCQKCGKGFLAPYLTIVYCPKDTDEIFGAGTWESYHQPSKEASKVGQFFEARGRREITDQRPTVNLYLPHQQGTSPYYLLEADDAERLGVALLQEAGLARKAATLLRESA